MLIKMFRFLSPADGGGGGGSPPPDGQVGDDDDLADLPPEVRERVERRIASERDRASNGAWKAAREHYKSKGDRRGGGAPTDTAPAANTVELLNQLVQVQIASALGGLTPTQQQHAPAGPPVTAGPPPSLPQPRSLDDIPFHKMNHAQREEYVNTRGAIAAKNKIFAEMASVQVTGVRRR